jgi:hypothetical protein
MPSHCALLQVLTTRTTYEVKIESLAEKPGMKFSILLEQLHDWKAMLYGFPGDSECQKETGPAPVRILGFTISSEKE